MPKVSRPWWATLSAILSVALGLSAPLFFPVFSQLLIIPIFLSLVILEYFRFKFLSTALYYQSMALFKIAPWLLFSGAFVALLALDFYSAKSLSSHLGDGSNRSSKAFLEYQQREQEISSYRDMCVDTYSPRVMSKRLKCLQLTPQSLPRPVQEGSDGVLLFMVAFFVLSVSLHAIALFPAFREIRDVFGTHPDDKKVLREEHYSNIVERQNIAHNIQKGKIQLSGLRERSLLLPIVEQIEEAKTRYQTQASTRTQTSEDDYYYKLILNEGQPQPLTGTEFAEASGLKNQALTRTYSRVSSILAEQGLIVKKVGDVHRRA